MLQTPPRTSERKDWLLAGGWTLTIYAAIPFARTIQAWVDTHGGRGLFSAATYAAILAGLMLLVAQARRGQLVLSRGRWAGLAFLAAAYAAGAFHLRANPEEALHLVQYGILSVLLLRAFSHRHRNRGAFAAALALGALLGVCDEIIQWITPRRFFDFRDILINVLAGALMQAGWVLFLRPPYLQAPCTAATCRRVRLLATAFLVLLFLCISNTPDRQRHYAKHLPLLDETMVEYGYRHGVKDGATFFSRFSLAALEEADLQRARDGGTALKERGHDDQYDEFLQMHNRMADPFLYELRVHMFRRDRYWKLARAQRGEGDAESILLAVAVGENSILQRHFGQTLRAGGKAWPADLQARAEAGARPGPYVSAVSNQLVTRFSQRQLQVAVAGLLLVTWLAGRYACRRANSP